MTAQPDVRRRTGGRSARVRDAVLAATLSIARQDGMDAVTVARVASDAEVHPTSIYRRWITRENLILDAIASEGVDRVAVADTGSLIGDLVAFATAVSDYLRSADGSALVRATVAATGGPALGAERSVYFADRLEQMNVLLDRAVERGEMTQPADTRLVLDSLVAPLQMRVATGEPLSADLADRQARFVHRALVGSPG